FSLDSIQNWEQGHRQPEGPARILLAVIAKNPRGGGGSSSLIIASRSGARPIDSRPAGCQPAPPGTPAIAASSPFPGRNRGAQRRLASFGRGRLRGPCGCNSP